MLAGFPTSISPGASPSHSRGPLDSIANFVLGLSPPPRPALTSGSHFSLLLVVQRGSKIIPLPALVLGGSKFYLETVKSGGRRDGVQRHVDDGGDTARGSRPRAGRETFPFCTAGLVEVDVGIDNAGPLFSIHYACHGLRETMVSVMVVKGVGKCAV